MDGATEQYKAKKLGLYGVVFFLDTSVLLNFCKGTLFFLRGTLGRQCTVRAVWCIVLLQ